ncbi:MAG TPA: hypothetical protein VK538_06415 [Solirubrobacteraceae bacterium]|nr:hypothetical protein [Solirubrobacteraceae bacterium]
MKFRIARHSGFAPPADALELLLRRLGARRGELTFAMDGDAITAISEAREAEVSTRDERAEAERRAIVDLLVDVCKDAPELQSDWFAVSYLA